MNGNRSFTRTVRALAVIVGTFVVASTSSAQCGVAADGLHPAEPTFNLGESVVMYDNVAIVSDRIGGPHVYRRDSGVWNHEQELFPVNNPVGERFGWYVDINNDVAIASAHTDDTLASNAGAAYVFRYDAQSGEWADEAKLFASDVAANDLFGQAGLAITPDFAFVGAPSAESDVNAWFGAVYVFEYDPASEQWAERQKITLHDSTAKIGRAIAVDGERLVIGSPDDDDVANRAGAAYMYRYDGAVWVFDQKLTADDGGTRDLLGGSVAVSGDVAVFGAQWDGDLGGNSGSAYVFRYDGEDWNQEQKLLAEDGAANDRFSTSVAASAGRIAVGASGAANRGVSSGVAYVFEFDGFAWSQSMKLYSTSSGDSDGFGQDAALCNGSLFVGANWNDAFANDSGAAYAFDASDPTDSGCDSDISVDCVVDTFDLLELIGNWGACQ